GMASISPPRTQPGTLCKFLRGHEGLLAALCSRRSGMKQIVVERECSWTDKHKHAVEDSEIDCVLGTRRVVEYEVTAPFVAFDDGDGHVDSEGQGDETGAETEGEENPSQGIGEGCSPGIEERVWHAHTLQPTREAFHAGGVALEKPEFTQAVDNDAQA